jgi:hypothetical protein
MLGEPAFLGEPALHGVARPRRWDVVTTAEAAGLGGDEVKFAALPDGTLIVDEETGDQSLEPLANAVEQQLPPPYRAEGVRQTDTLWTLSASKIAVERFDADGDRLELTRTAEGKTLVVDGTPAFGTVRELEDLGNAAGDAYTVEAERLDADLWEVRVAPL